jgi:RNA polymerase sigma-70 factor (ECF subfamily)
MLGEVAAAEDVVQDSFLRFAKHANTIQNDGAWLTTTVARLALDAATSARARREHYVGPWLPEPIENTNESAHCTQDLSFALLVLLETLSAKERAVFVLRELFDVSYEDIATTLDANEPAVRQLFHRALESLRARRHKYVVDEVAHRELLAAFVQAVVSGNVDVLTSLLAHDVTASSDGGGKRSAALKIVSGQNKVLRLILGLVSKGTADFQTRFAMMNNTPALVLQSRGVIDSVIQLIADDTGRIAQICFLRNPDKLTRIH